MPLRALQHERATTGPCSPLLSVAKRIFQPDWMTAESGVHPLGLATVPVVVPSGSIGRLEWQPHSSAVNGPWPARSSEMRKEDGCCGVEAEIGAALCGEPRCGDFLMSCIFVHVPMSLRARISVPDEWWVVKGS